MPFADEPFPSEEVVDYPPPLEPFPQKTEVRLLLDDMELAGIRHEDLSGQPTASADDQYGRFSNWQGAGKMRGKELANAAVDVLLAV
jgi:hypothetical protein